MNTRNKKNLLPRCLYIFAMAVVLLFSAVSNAPAPVSPGTDPLVSVYYGLEVEGTSTGYFTEASGIGSENEIVEQKIVDKIGNEIVRKLPGRLKWYDVTLKRGLTSTMDVWTWRKLVEDGSITNARKNFTITMYDQTGAPRAKWNFINGWPSKIEAGLAASGSAAIESITITHEGMYREQ
jgi:phage tail-like protein